MLANLLSYYCGAFGSTHFICSGLFWCTFSLLLLVCNFSLNILRFGYPSAVAMACMLNMLIQFIAGWVKCFGVALLRAGFNSRTVLCFWICGFACPNISAAIHILVQLFPPLGYCVLFSRQLIIYWPLQIHTVLTSLRMLPSILGLVPHAGTSVSVVLGVRESCCWYAILKRPVGRFGTCPDLLCTGGRAMGCTPTQAQMLSAATTTRNVRNVFSPMGGGYSHGAPHGVRYCVGLHGKLADLDPPPPLPPPR